MFRTPSSRRKSAQQEVQLNLVPMLDALVTLVSFLLLTMGYMAISVIDTPAPMVAPAEEQIEKIEKDKPLQLTAHILKDKIIISDWSGSRENHEIKTVPSTEADAKPGDVRYDLESLHKLLITIKGRHPKEKQLILKPDADVPYEQIINVMDASRYFDKTDVVPENIKTKDVNGNEVPDTNLFPEVVFGNILSS